MLEQNLFHQKLLQITQKSQEALGRAYFYVEALPSGRKRSEPEVP